MKIHALEKNLFVLPEMLRLVAKKKLNGDCMNNLFSQNNFVCTVSSWQLIIITDKYKIYVRELKKQKNPFNVPNFAISLLLKQWFFGVLLITLIYKQKSTILIYP